MPRPKKAIPNRSDGRYEVKITIGKTFEGKPIRKSFYSDVSKADATEKAKEYETNSAVASALGTAYVNKNMSFGEWANMWLEKYKKNNVKESTYLETYKRTVETYLVPFFGKAQLSAIQPINVQEFYTEMQSKYHETTLKKMQLCLRAIFESAIDNDLCHKNPAKNVTYKVIKENERKNTYSQKEADTILKFSDTHKYGLYIRILLELGLRCSELLGLKWIDIDYEKKSISIERASTAVSHKAVIDKPKSKSSMRVLPLSFDLINQLKLHQNDDGHELIVNSAGKPFTAANFTKNRYRIFFEDLQKEHPEIKKLSPHELRHTCGTLLYEKTKDIFAVSKYLGHANIDITTKLYVHESVDLLRSHLNII